MNLSTAQLQTDAGSEEVPKHRRQRKSSEQKTMLNKLLLERFAGFSPRGEELQDLSQMTGLQPRQITSWFSDQRRRVGRVQKMDCPSDQYDQHDQATYSGNLSISMHPGAKSAFVAGQEGIAVADVSATAVACAAYLAAASRVSPVSALALATVIAAAAAPTNNAAANNPVANNAAGCNAASQAAAAAIATALIVATATATAPPSTSSTAVTAECGSPTIESPPSCVPALGHIGIEPDRVALIEGGPGDRNSNGAQ
jgi:hypothetical protein